MRVSPGCIWCLWCLLLPLLRPCPRPQTPDPVWPVQTRPPLSARSSRPWSPTSCTVCAICLCLETVFFFKSCLDYPFPSTLSDFMSCLAAFARLGLGGPVSLLRCVCARQVCWWAMSPKSHTCLHRWCQQWANCTTTRSHGPQSFGTVGFLPNFPTPMMSDQEGWSTPRQLSVHWTVARSMRDIHLPFPKLCCGIPVRPSGPS